jgi:hypothetical protein
LAPNDSMTLQDARSVCFLRSDQILRRRCRPLQLSLQKPSNRHVSTVSLVFSWVALSPGKSLRWWSTLICSYNASVHLLAVSFLSVGDAVTLLVPGMVVLVSGVARLCLEMGGRLSTTIMHRCPLANETKRNVKTPIQRLISIKPSSLDSTSKGKLKRNPARSTTVTASLHRLRRT